jgi:hypothetical protein
VVAVSFSASVELQPKSDLSFCRATPIHSSASVKHGLLISASAELSLH